MGDLVPDLMDLGKESALRQKESRKQQKCGDPMGEQL
jgi:hypothetical protein